MLEIQTILLMSARSRDKRVTLILKAVDRMKGLPQNALL